MTAVQYQIRRDLVKAACFDIESPLSQIEAEVDSVLRTTLPGMTLDESYQAKEKMVELILASVQEAMKRYGYDIIKDRLLTYFLIFFFLNFLAIMYIFDTCGLQKFDVRC